MHRFYQIASNKQVEGYIRSDKLPLACLKPKKTKRQKDKKTKRQKEKKKKRKKVEGVRYIAEVTRRWGQFEDYNDDQGDDNLKVYKGKDEFED